MELMDLRTMRTMISRPNILLASFIASLAGCATSGSPTRPYSPPVVEVAQIEQRNVPIYREWIGTLTGMVNTDVKAEVSNYLQRQDYLEGAPVRKGQLLFEIDPRPFEAALSQARGDLARAEGQLLQSNAQSRQAQAQLRQAEADQLKAQLDVDRYTPLAKEGAVTRQNLDDAIQINRAAQAQVEAARAGVETSKAAVDAAKAAVDVGRAEVRTAEINLGYTRIVSPIDGIAGRAVAQVGDLVGPGSGALTTISTVDPIRVYFTVSEQEYLRFATQYPTRAAREAEDRHMELSLVLADGTIYPQKGKFYFMGRQVDPKTGAIRLAGVFPNPQGILRPGQYCRVRAVTRIMEGALLVPQRAVTELQGAYQVAVVGNDDRVSIRGVQVGEREGTMWIVENGLRPGERIVVEGLQRIRSGMLVSPKPFVPQNRQDPAH
jgi:membrane fusion protein (multidrug efflux system)